MIQLNVYDWDAMIKWILNRLRCLCLLFISVYYHYNYCCRQKINSKKMYFREWHRFPSRMISRSLSLLNGFLYRHFFLLKQKWLDMQWTENILLKLAEYRSSMDESISIENLNTLINPANLIRGLIGDIQLLFSLILSHRNTRESCKFA